MPRPNCHTTSVFACMLAGFTACGDDTASSGSASAGETGGATTLTSAGASSADGTGGDASGADTTGFEPDQVACLPDPNPTPCPLGTVAPCCAGSPPGVTCPGVYPHNWTCNPSTLQCELGNCTLNGTECADLFTGFSCLTVGAKNRCVFGCTVDQDCAEAMPGTACIASDVPAQKYCRQPV